MVMLEILFLICFLSFYLSFLNHAEIIFVVRFVNFYFDNIWIVCLNQKWLLSKNMNNFISPQKYFLSHFSSLKICPTGYFLEVSWRWTFSHKCLSCCLHIIDIFSLLMWNVLIIHYNSLCASDVGFSILFHWSVYLISSAALYLLDTIILSGKE